VRSGESWRSGTFTLMERQHESPGARPRRRRKHSWRLGAVRLRGQRAFPTSRERAAAWRSLRALSPGRERAALPRASETLYAGASEWRARGASERLYLGASEWRERGASEARFAGASERLYAGASERTSSGASENRPPISDSPVTQRLNDANRVLRAGPPRSPAVRPTSRRPDGDGGAVALRGHHRHVPALRPDV
jgi:hypothetical protein